MDLCKKHPSFRERSENADLAVRESPPSLPFSWMISIDLSLQPLECFLPDQSFGISKQVSEILASSIQDEQKRYQIFLLARDSFSTEGETLI